MSADRVTTEAGVTGVARLDKRTKNLTARLEPGDIAIIDHPDLDLVAAETLVACGVGAVINVADSMTGRYPNQGPVVVTAAGIPLLDAVDPAVFDRISEGDVIQIDGNDVRCRGRVVGSGTALSAEAVTDRLEALRKSMGSELERFAENTIAYLRQEKHLLLDAPDLPEIPVDFVGRHALIVVRGADYKEDLALLKRTGYLRDIDPVLIGVDGGADALLESGVKPDIIIGDFDSVSERALRCGALLVVHGYLSGDAPGSKRLEALGLDHEIFSAAGTSEDIAMLMAFERGAELIVAVGSHTSMIDFLDKGRNGMASTVLVRMKVGSRLVDARGVSRLYHSTVRTFDIVLLIVSALSALIVVGLMSEPVRLFLRSLWLAWS
ncbi:MAG: hypothetical protein JST73_00610 [Actinobacteria bacterium]|nr:hypothetical protein [Actinomycetota bacterium]